VIVARQVQNAKIDTRSARAKLPHRREPYWTRLQQGLAVGYRKGAKGGTWIGRYRGVDAKQHYLSIGLADDNLDADAARVFDYTGAQEQVREWFKRENRRAAGIDAADSGPYKVEDAIRDYLAALEADGKSSAADARRRANLLILPRLRSIEVGGLNGKRIREWHREMSRSLPMLRAKKGGKRPHRAVDLNDFETARQRQSTANRVLTILKAALNRAFADSENKAVTSDLAWRSVKPFRQADAPRVRYLAVDEATRLANAAGTVKEFRSLIRGGLLTGCRYSELARLHVSDFNRDAGAIHVRIGKSRKGRNVVLTDEGTAFFERQTAGRRGDELMFPWPDGKAWGASHQQRPMVEACKAARLAPPITFHGLRHTYASHAVMNGMPLMVVAQNLGHADTRMVEKHYGHLAPSYVAETVRKHAPRFGIADRGKVRVLRPRKEPA
jgi:integrase